MFSSQHSQVSSDANYIEDVFSTYLYTGTGATQSIVNGIDESGKGALTWIKNRSTASEHALFDTTRGVNKALQTQSTAAEFSYAGMLTAFNSNGFSLGTDGVGFVNVSGDNYASWTFRKQPKFFDIVTWTGNGVNGRAISHNLGAVPGCMIIKKTSAAEQWAVYHRSTGNTQYGMLDQTNAFDTFSGAWNNTTPTDTVFTVGNWAKVNESGQTYVAYLFAHNAGGFGLTGTDNVISCGSFTTSSGGGDATVDLGYEPQWLLVKSASGTSGWDLMDNMRGMPNYGTYGSATALEANNSNAEGSRNPNCYPTATGFYYARAASTTYIYIAIRRGPMKVPTSGTSVFDVDAYTGNGATNRQIDSGFVDDWFFFKNKALVNDWFSFDRLRGDGNYLAFDTTGAESGGGTDWVRFTQTQTGIVTGQAAYGDINTNGVSNVAYHFKRAPGFFDEVCYTGTGSDLTLNHNLGVVPEMMIVKCRSNASTNWIVYHSALGNTGGYPDYLSLNTTNAVGSGSSSIWTSTPSSTTFSVGTFGGIGGTSRTYVAYLFATCAGVSKVGSYTGNGSTQTIDCGFTGGARFVLIKRTDSTGDWYVWDTARGIVSGNDPYLLLNSTAAEVTNTDYIDTYSAGFEISSTAPSAINANGGTFIYFSVA